MYAVFLAVQFKAGPAQTAFLYAKPGSLLCNFEVSIDLYLPFALFPLSSLLIAFLWPKTKMYFLLFIDNHASLSSVLITYVVYASVVNPNSYDHAYVQYCMLLFCTNRM